MFSKKEFVMCVDSSVKGDNLIEIMSSFQEWIIKDIVYQIRYVQENEGIVTGLLLYGVENKPIFIPILKRTQEPAFASWRFRKLTPEEKIKVEELYKEAKNKLNSINDGQLVEENELIEINN